MSHFNIMSDANVNWMIQLEYQIPRVINLLPSGGEHELKVETDDFIGFIDYVCGDTLYDFKFSNNVESYSQSPQLSIYKHYLEKVRPDIKINHLKYIMIPKIMIRQKKTETIQQFRQRLLEKLEESEIKIVEVNFDETMVTQFQECCKALNLVDDFPKNPSRLCDWCEYKAYCDSNGEENWMII